MRSTAAAVVAVVFAGLGMSVSASAQTVSRVGQAPLRPDGALTVGPLADSATISVTIALAPPDPGALASYATAVSTPGSAEYGHYLSVAAFRSRFAPSDAQAQAVRAALSADGLNPSAVSANGLEITLTASAARLSSAFATSFQQVSVGGRTAYANTSAPALPSSIAATVQGVIGLDDLTRPQPLDKASAAAAKIHAAALRPHVATGGPQPCAAATTEATTNNSLTADQLASAYDFSGLYQEGDKGAGETIGLFELAPYEPSDIAAYQSCYGTDASVSNVVVDGGPGTGANDEATGDIEDVIGLAPQASVIAYEGPNSGSGWVDTLNAMVEADAADVFSISWQDSCGAPSAAIGQAEGDDLEEAAIQGETFLGASGDDGSEECDFSQRNDVPDVGDPATQPFLTAVGGTGITALGPPLTETTWNEGGSATGGGVGSVAMPAYQLDASSALNVIGPYSSGAPCGAPAGQYCREVPDVSADASGLSGYVFYVGEQWIAQRGTSYASPLWAAFVALTNASPDCATVSDVAFLDPLLYQLAGSSSSHSYFNDITTGNNDVGGLDGGLYPAGPGYDMATGLGTPIAPALASALCAAKVSAVTVAKPDAQSTEVGTLVSLAVNATDATDTFLSYSATGLPAGLTIDSSGVISGTPTSSGTSTVTVTVSDLDGATSQAVFNWAVTGRPATVATAVDDAATGSPWAVTETVGSAASATAILTTAGPTPTGTVNYELFNNAQCTAPATDTETVTLTGAGSVPASAGSAALAAGSYGYQASYSGDSQYAAATGPCDAFAVAPATVTNPPATISTPAATTPVVTSTPAATTPVTTTTPVCPAATGRVTGTSLGPVTLGMTAARIQKAHTQAYKAVGKNGATLCLTPTGISLVYAPAKLIASLSAAARKRDRGALVFAYTTNAHYAVSGIHVGSTLTAARKALKGGNELVVTGTTWYVVQHGSVTLELSVVHGRVTRLGIATRALNGTKAQELRFLRDTV